jgi:RES domain-containing protein
MVYTAGSLSLAVIEMLVHLEATALLDLYVSIPLSFPRNLCKRLSLEDLPNDWTSDPAPMSTKDIGTSWLKSQESPVLAVPSSIVRIETCFLLNPCHPEFGRIEIGSAEEFRFDPRLLKEGRCY